MDILYDNIQVSAFREPATFIGISFYLRVKNPVSGIVSLPGPLVLEEQNDKDLAVWHPPLFHLNADNAQSLMDDLWNAGIRPSNAEEAAGELKATKYHLEDLREMLRVIKPVQIEVAR